MLIHDGPVSEKTWLQRPECFARELEQADLKQEETSFYVKLEQMK